MSLLGAQAVIACFQSRHLHGPDVFGDPTGDFQRNHWRFVPSAVADTAPDRAPSSRLPLQLASAQDALASVFDQLGVGCASFVDALNSNSPHLRGQLHEFLKFNTSGRGQLAPNTEATEVVLHIDLPIRSSTREGHPGSRVHRLHWRGLCQGEANPARQETCNRKTESARSCAQDAHDGLGEFVDLEQPVLPVLQESKRTTEGDPQDKGQQFSRQFPASNPRPL